MTKEERDKLKEAEKAHLRKLRELKQAVHVLERQRSVSDALQQMTSATEDALDTQAEMVEKLALETARQEARLEMALDAEAERGAEEDAASMEEAEEEAQRRRARDLIRQLKLEMGGPDAADGAAGGAAGEAPEKSLGGAPRREGASRSADAEDRPPPPNPTRPPGDRPDKTIGRM